VDRREGKKSLESQKKEADKADEFEASLVVEENILERIHDSLKGMSCLLLLAINVDQANRITYRQHRWKVITLTGQLIELSGTMSGGGGQPARGGMSSKLAADAVRQEVLRGYKKDREDAAQHFRDGLCSLGC
jgi:chromosome segregation ATPase